MNPKHPLQIRLNFIDLVIEDLRQNPVTETAEGQQHLMELLDIYRTDTVRRMEGRLGSIHYLFQNLKYGVRLADMLIDDMCKYQRDAVEGWYFGKPAMNRAQHVYNVIQKTGLELSYSIRDIESQYPQHAEYFDAERKRYAASLN